MNNGLLPDGIVAKVGAFLHHKRAGPAYPGAEEEVNNGLHGQGRQGLASSCCGSSLLGGLLQPQHKTPHQRNSAIVPHDMCPRRTKRPVHKGDVPAALPQ